MNLIGTILGWKFNHAEGMTVRDGVITEFPSVATDRDGLTHTGEIPSRSELDQWTTEYETWLAEQPEPKTPEQEISELKAQLAKVQTQIGKAVPTYQPVDLAAAESVRLE